MKKIYFLVVMAASLSITYRAASNPVYIPPPQAIISELKFTSATDWTLELAIFISCQDPSFFTDSIFDSIVIQTNAGRTKLLSYPVGWYQLFLVTPASLNNLLTINSVQDTIRVISYVDPNFYPYGAAGNTHMLVYGYSDCEIPVLNIGQSVCVKRSQGEISCYDIDWLYFYLDNSPTLGIDNDTIGATFEVYGRFYDYQDSLVTYAPPGKQFAFPVNIEPYKRMGWNGWETYFYARANFTFDNQGYYHTKLLSRNCNDDYIDYVPANVYNYFYYSEIEKLNCDSIAFFHGPGGIQYLDIHLADSSFLVGLAEKPKVERNALTVVCGPNPVDHGGTFYIASEKPELNAVIQVFSLTGQPVMQFDIPHEMKSQLKFTRDQLGESGIYVYVVIQEGRKVITGQIICR
jgi:hypothetical protein